MLSIWLRIQLSSAQHKSQPSSWAASFHPRCFRASLTQFLKVVLGIHHPHTPQTITLFSPFTPLLSRCNPRSIYSFLRSHTDPIMDPMDHYMYDCEQFVHVNTLTGEIIGEDPDAEDPEDPSLLHAYSTEFLARVDECMQQAKVERNQGIHIKTWRLPPPDSAD